MPAAGQQLPKSPFFDRRTYEIRYDFRSIYRIVIPTQTVTAMKKWSILSAIALFAAVLTGCTSAYYTSSGYAGDDLYVTHDKTEIARRQQQAAEARKAEADARRAEWEARIAEAQAAAAESRYNSTVSGSGSYNTYANVLADTYESAYARRLRGFESLTYRLPSSYFNFRYGDAFTYVSAYDPAFYNIVISGDQVWVEPKYITSMFGTWGATVYNSGWYGNWGWNFGWNYMPRWWGYSTWGWNWGYAWHPWHTPGYRPAAWRPGWGLAWGPGPVGGGWGYRPAHNYRLDSYPRPGNNAGYRAPATSGSRSGTSGGVNSGRRGSSYNTGGSYNSNGNRNNGSYNSGGSSSRSGSSNNNGSSWNSNSSGRSNGGSSYNNGGSRSSGSGYSGGSSGGSRSGGGGSYNRGR